MDKDNIFNNIDEYHSLLSADIQKQLEQLRQTIRQAAPFATETISYGMSAFKQNRVLVTPPRVPYSFRLINLFHCHSFKKS